MKAKNEMPNEYEFDPKYGERMKICKGADENELVENKRCLGSLLDSFPDMTAVIRKHVDAVGVKNPEYIINGLIADRKGIQSEKGISNSFNRAIKQGCKAVVIDLDLHMQRVNNKRLATHIQWRYSDFEQNLIEHCYVVLNGKAVDITKETLDRGTLIEVLKRLKP